MAGVQGSSDPNRELLDAAALVGHLVPAGSVGIAGPQTGIYSLPTPGGWQLIGRTPLRLFNPVWDAPSLLQAGQRLRFVPISEAEYQSGLQHES